MNTTPPSPTYTDVNLTLSRWPFRRLPLDATPALVTKLRDLRITRAFAANFDALLHRDLAASNARLADECKHHPDTLLPFGCVNPTLPDWEDDLRRCHELHRMPGLRLHPNYHGYSLNDEPFRRLATLAAERNLILQISASMEDERTHHPLMKVPPVDASPLPALLKTLPTLRVVLLNASRAVRGVLVKQLLDAGQVYFDIATLEGVAGLRNLLNTLPPTRILFGSHAPLFYPEAAVLKMKESALDERTFTQIARENASRLLAV